jgi:hypothetical protein
LHIVVNHPLCARPCVLTIESLDFEIFTFGIGSAGTFLLKWLSILATPYIFIIESSNCKVFKLGLQDPLCWNNFWAKFCDDQW